MSPRPVDPELPQIPVHLAFAASGCEAKTQCKKYVTNIEDRLVGKYFTTDTPFDGQIPTAYIDLRDLNYDSYLAIVKKRYKGNVIRDARKSDKEGFVSKPFARKLFIPDLVEINQSMEVRSGGPMKQHYLKSIQDMGGAPKKRFELPEVVCPLHYDLWWGCFKPEPGHTQGDIVTDEKLIAYIDFRRVGDLAIYSLIIGHGDFLRYGIMYRLHFAIMEWLCDESNHLTKGLKSLMYAGFYQGSTGLQLWKKKTAFAPGYLRLEDKSGAEGGRSSFSGVRDKLLGLLKS